MQKLSEHIGIRDGAIKIEEGNIQLAHLSLFSARLLKENNTKAHFECH